MVTDPPRKRPAAVALAVLLVAWVVIAVVFTPWHPLGGHVPGGHVAADPTRDFTPAQIARESSYHRALRPWGLATLAIAVIAPALVGFTPIGARAVGRLRRLPWLLRVVLAVVGMTLLVAVVTLPAAIHAHVVQRDYGLTTQGWVGWTNDYARGWGVQLVTTAIAVLVVLAIARRSPRRWWIAAGLVGAMLVFVGSFVYPVLVEPVFNKFTPLPDGPLRTQLLALARSDGVHLHDILVADASRRTTTDNAYVSGFGASRRLVLYDTLLRHDSPQQIEVITAHELGHVKHNDVLFGTTLGALAVAAGMCGAFLAFRDGGAASRRLGFTGASDPRVIPALLAAFAVASFLTTPVTNLVSRHIEARADAHALHLTHDPADYISAQRDLAVRGLDDLDPPALVYAWFLTHPTPPQRIAMARDWQRQHPR